MATRMQQRRGTAAEWAAQNPVLADGELGFERDTKIIKLGDGVTPWSGLSLPYLPSGGGQMTGILDMNGNRIDNIGPMATNLDMGDNSIEHMGPMTDELNMAGFPIQNPGAIGPLQADMNANDNTIANLPDPTSGGDAIPLRYADTGFVLVDHASGTGTSSTLSVAVPAGALVVKLVFAGSLSAQSNLNIRVNGDTSAGSHRSGLHQVLTETSSATNRTSDSAILIADGVRIGIFGEATVNCASRFVLGNAMGHQSSQANLVVCTFGGTHTAGGSVTAIQLRSSPGNFESNFDVFLYATFSQTPRRP